MSTIVFRDGAEMRPEEAIVRLAQELTELRAIVEEQDRIIDRLEERVQWFESQGI